MSEKIAYVYWCDGTGHAARSIPVAKEFESRGHEVVMAGGGPGRRFVEMNGWEEPDITEVYVKGDGFIDSVRQIFGHIIPDSVRRFRDVYGWLKEEEPDKMITDDLFAAAAASIQGIEFYRIDHLTPELFGPMWRIPFEIWNRTSLLFAENIIVTCLWPEADSPKGVKRVSPLAQEGDDEVEPYDTLISPGSHATNFDEIREGLEEEGMNVRTVGDDEWETKPSMTPYTSAADSVVCTGFSSIADAVVAGTPAIIYPFLPFQKALARRVEELDMQGIEVVRSVDEAVEMAKKYSEEDLPGPEFENGDERFVDIVLGEDE